MRRSRPDALGAGGSMVGWWMFGVAALASEVFPEAAVTEQAAVAVLVPALVGPPASRYDHTPRPTAATALERSLGATAAPEATAAAPEGLLRYGRIVAALRLAGEPQTTQTGWVAEHVGLHSTPTVWGYFCQGGEDTTALAEQAREFVAEAMTDDTVTALAVGLTPWAEGGWCGAVVSLSDSVALEPFPRALPAGGHTTLSGRFVGKGDLVALYVNQPAGAVATYPIPGTGVFHLGVPAPAEPGVYRAATNRVMRKSLPDTPTFFSFYVGVDLPDRYAPPIAVGGAPEADTATAEREFLAGVNRYREAHGLPKLAAVGSPDALRALLEGLPAGERARYRYLSRYFREDPLPTQAHGTWGAGFSTASNAATAAWWATEHPVLRADLGTPAMDAFLVGAAGAGEARTFAFVTLDAQVDDTDSRERVREVLAARWTPAGTSPNAAPDLEAKLDAIAERVMSSGWSLGRAVAEVNKLFKDPALVRGPGNTWALIGPIGALPDLSTVQPASGHGALAIGKASGTIEGATQASTLYLVVSTFAAR